MEQQTIYQRGCAAFHQQLPQLMCHDRDMGKWVAFLGDRLVGIHEDRDSLYDQAAIAIAGLNLNDLFVSQIAPEESLEAEAARFR